MRLLTVEVRRCLHRRLTWVLVGLGLLGVVVAGLVAFFTTRNADLAARAARGERSPAVLLDWWVPGTVDGMLGMAAFFLMMGGLIGGASIVGAEWRAGTVTTLLTWEPRRLRVHAARVAAAVACATVISFVLQALFLASFVPAVLAHGTTDGADGAWFASLVAAMARVSLLTAVATVVGASVASLGRNTTAALAVGWGWMAVGENLTRILLPDLRPLLIGENASVLLAWNPLEAGIDRSPAVALCTLVAYALVLVAVAAVRFERRDIAVA